jgi:hypothetical protein
MKIAALDGGAATAAVRDTAGQDFVLTVTKTRRMGCHAGAGAPMLAAFIGFAHASANTRHVVSREVLRTAAVTRGHFASESLTGKDLNARDRNRSIARATQRWELSERLLHAQDDECQQDLSH